MAEIRIDSDIEEKEQEMKQEARPDDAADACGQTGSGGETAKQTASEDVRKAEDEQTPQSETGEAAKAGGAAGTAQKESPEQAGSGSAEESGNKDAQDSGDEDTAADATENASGDDKADNETKDGQADEEDVQDGTYVQKEGGLKGFFKKKDKKDKRDQQIEELTDRVRRQMAEFDNFRKRTEKEKSAMYEVGAKSVIEKILPVVDNFERGLATAENTEDPFVDGMQKIYKQLMTTLEGMDVKPIEAVGKEFNPELHNAVMHVDDESVGENIVVEELQKGYMYRESVVRYSMVKVAN